MPLIATNCVKNSTLYPVLEKVRYVDRHTYETWFRGHPEPGDLIFVCKGSPGQVCLAPDPVSFCIAQDMVAIRADPKRVYPAYLFAALRSPEVQFDIGNMHVGTLIPHFKKGDFDKLSIPLPPPAQQRIIGDWHLAIESKIDLNRRMNETLEAMAQAIFRDWFVDFGPVRRKMAGATDPVAIMGGLIPDPTRAAELAALFPDAFGDDGFPVGWSEKPLDQIADFLNGLALQKFPARPGEPSLPVIKIAELRGGLTEKTNRASHDLPERYIIRDGDFLFSWSGSLMAKVWTEGEGALNQHLFKVSSAKYPQWFYARWVHHHMPEFQSIAASKATTMGHIQRGHLSSAMTVCPPDKLLNEMSKVMDPLWQRAIHNDLENRNLAETRDYLLPRLMSGEVRVGDGALEIAA
ncbi:restriction endonuclease subunit S [Sphingobium baderi]|nr:restriction endonuclease subunit S [Sphingobium baderi]